MRKIPAASLLLLLFIGCKNESKFSPDNKYDIREFSIDSATAIRQLVDISSSVVVANFSDSTRVNAAGKRILAIYPPSTKQIEWYQIINTVGGSAVVNFHCTDNSTYTTPVPVASVAAVSSLLQASYVRIDTTPPFKIYSYKTALRGF